MTKSCCDVCEKPMLPRKRSDARLTFPGGRTVQINISAKVNGVPESATVLICDECIAEVLDRGCPCDENGDIKGANLVD